MISKLVGVPYTKFIDIRQLFTIEMACPIMHIDKEAYVGSGFFIYKPPTSRKTTTKTRFAYASTIYDVLPIQELLAEANEPICTLVGGAPASLNEYGVPVLPQTYFSPNRMFALGESTSTEGIELAKIRSLNDEVIANVKPSLLLQKLHPLFYRVSDKEQRRAVQFSTYQYLLGYIAKPQTTSVAALDQLLQSEAARTLRQQVTVTRERGITIALEVYPEMDEYEIRYLLSRDALLTKEAAAKNKPKSKRN